MPPPRLVILLVAGASNFVMIHIYDVYVLLSIKFSSVHLSGSWFIKETGESMTRVDSPVLLMHHDPDRSWITDPDPDHLKGMRPKIGLQD